ncbi:MAG TPA: hypothetical protein VMU08_11295 [Rhizomicrobium sp.]|nr:hypothetical protein [Rhizomicrobium sp.]
MRREWLAARVMATLAGLLLLGLATMSVIGWWQGPQPGESAPAAPASAPAALPEAEARRQEGIAICTAALSAAQNLGLVPGFATLDGGDTKSTDVQGRYVCAAKTDAAKYAVTFDLTCTNLGAGNCIAIYSIVQDGSTVLYKRS